MGGYRWKRKRGGGSKNDDKSSKAEIKDSRDSNPYKPTPTENASFERYYLLQGIVREDVWNDFMASLRRPLPATFRITGNRKIAEWVKDQLNAAIPVNSEQETFLKCFDWYPHAFQINTDRKTIRSDPSYERFHQTLVSLTANGDVSRQEAVSMIPPLFMSIEPDHLVLDMCAAPGSKTAQLVEMLHQDGEGIPRGMVIANDVNQQRAYMLHHQVKRILSPALLVSNNDGAHFPNIYPHPSFTDSAFVEALQFDRILCDVPCSGDGTLRKNLGLWGSWNVHLALGLHQVQLRLLERALQMTRVGGRIVYSTCSLNPIENEAVIATVLQRYSSSLRLVDVGDALPGLEREPGISTWTVTNKDATVVYANQDSVPEAEKRRYPASVFAPSEAMLSLERCIRILPHRMDTGGFFVAVLEKTAELATHSAEQRRRRVFHKNDSTNAIAPEQQISERNEDPPLENHKEEDIKEEDIGIDSDADEAENVSQAALTKMIRSKHQQEPFVLVDYAHESLQSCFSFYGIPATKLPGGFVCRSERDPIKTLTFVSEAVKSVLSGQNFHLKIVNCGIRAFEHYDLRVTATNEKDNGRFACMYRLLMESVGCMMSVLAESQRLVKDAPVSLLKAILDSDNSVDLATIPSLEDALIARIDNLPDGGLLMIGGIEGNSNDKIAPVVMIPCWKNTSMATGARRCLVKAFVPKENRPAMVLQLNEK